MLVKDVMSQSVTGVNADDRLADAVALMTQQRHSCLVVVEANKPVGIVTERDLAHLLNRAFSQSLDKDMVVAGIMTPRPICASQSMTLADALALSRTRKVRHLPVVDDNNQLIGLVTQTNMVNTYADILAEQARLETNLEELKHLSLEDPLMGIGNRRAMEVDLAFTEADAKRHKKSYAVSLVDIDYFKKYNDHYGHQSGDEALRQVADIVKATVRDSDRVFRYGGEEILIVMPETDLKAAQLCIERVRQSLEEAAIPHQHSPFGFLTVSGGVAAGVASPWATLVADADKGLYEAKGAGRNRIHLSG